MRLPNAERAIVDIAKLRDYCLNLEHPRGKHKARVFRSALGLSRESASWLRAQLLAAALQDEAVPGDRDAYGQRYSLDTLLVTAKGTAWVRSSWMVRSGEEVARLTSCYVL